MAVAKIMPHSVEAEQALLGCLLIDQDAPLAVMAGVKSSDFYIDAHRNIFDQMEKLYHGNKPIDFVTLTESLEGVGLLDNVGGVEYIAHLTNVVPSSGNFAHYMEIVKKHGMLRSLISAGQDIIEKSFDGESGEMALDYAEKKIFDLAKKEETSSLEHIGISVNQAIEMFDKIAKNGGVAKGILTGLKDLDNITNGLQNSDLVLIAARPGVGKTSFAMQIVNYCALNNKKKCAIFSLEMAKIQIAQRSVCSIGCVSMGKALKGKLEMDEWKSIWAASKKLSEANVFVDDSGSSQPMDIISKCRRLKREQGLDLVVIDYLQLMSSSKKQADNRNAEISEITRTMKLAARELDIPIILLSQLSRDVTKRKDHKPQLSDLRDSGAVEQDADIVMFIHDPSMYNDVVTEDDPDMREIILAKHRNGETGSVKVRWVGELVTFFDINQKLPKLKPATATLATPPPSFDPDELARSLSQPQEQEEQKEI
ncbi:MAG: replicative DNA helicase [Clostridia bacterium]